jgi:drug/metabolite transporter (DMT)-like permease
MLAPQRPPVNAKADPPTGVAQSTRLGLMFALLGFSSLSIGDALVKSMADQWPGTAIALLRYIFGTLFLAALVAWRSGWNGFAVDRYDLQLARGAAVAVASVSFFLSLQLMPLATATSIQFTSPIWVALLSPWLLGEKATRSAWLCTGLALAGVGIVLRPSLADLGLAAFLPVVAALGLAILVILNRKISGRSDSILALQFWVAAMATPILGLFALLGHFSGMPTLRLFWPEAVVVLKCFGTALTGTLAHWLIFVATERASAPLVAPMVYVQLLIAGVLGWLLFGNAIDPISALGMAVIILAGLLLWRTQREPVVAVAPD